MANLANHYYEYGDTVLIASLDEGLGEDNFGVLWPLTVTIQAAASSTGAGANAGVRFNETIGGADLAAYIDASTSSPPDAVATGVLHKRLNRLLHCLVVSARPALAPALAVAKLAAPLPIEDHNCVTYRAEKSIIAQRLRDAHSAGVGAGGGFNETTGRADSAAYIDASASSLPDAATVEVLHKNTDPSVADRVAPTGPTSVPAPSLVAPAPELPATTVPALSSSTPTSEPPVASICHGVHPTAAGAYSGGRAVCERRFYPTPLS